MCHELRARDVDPPLCGTVTSLAHDTPSVPSLWSSRRQLALTLKLGALGGRGLPSAPAFLSRNDFPVLVAGFMRFVVGPLFAEWARFMRTALSRTMLANIASNMKAWDAVIAEEAAAAAAHEHTSQERVRDVTVLRWLSNTG